MPAAHQQFTPNPVWHEAEDDFLDRQVGGFYSCGEPTWGLGWYTQCCNANLPQGLYKAWSAIPRPQRRWVRPVCCISARSASPAAGRHGRYYRLERGTSTRAEAAVLSTTPEDGAGHLRPVTWR